MQLITAICCLFPVPHVTQNLREPGIPGHFPGISPMFPRDPMFPGNIVLNRNSLGKYDKFDWEYNRNEYVYQVIPRVRVYNGVHLEMAGFCFSGPHFQIRDFGLRLFFVKFDAYRYIVRCQRPVGCVVTGIGYL